MLKKNQETSGSSWQKFAEFQAELETQIGKKTDKRKKRTDRGLLISVCILAFIFLWGFLRFLFR